MESALVVSVALLWVLVIALGVVVLALLRQVGVLHERIAPAGALLGGERPAPGDTAPVLELKSHEGRGVRVGGADEQGRETLLLFVSPDCPVCKHLLPWVRSVRDAEAPGARVVIASDGDSPGHEDLARRHVSQLGPYVLSPELGRAYQVGRVPHAVLIDAGGTVRARGLVNTREHLESLFEAMRRGVAAVQDLSATAEGTGEHA